MASLWSAAPKLGGRRRREAAPQGSWVCAEPVPRAPAEDSKGVEFQNSSIVRQNNSSVSKTTVDVEQKVDSGSVQKSKRFHDQNVSEKRKRTLDWGLVRRFMWEAFLVNMDRRTLQEIDRALEVAINNLQRLKTAEEILEQLVTEAKQEEGKTASVIDATFTDFIAALNSRKRKLQTELVVTTSTYITDVHKVQLSVAEKKSSLDRAIKIARELKAKNSLKKCHSLNQILYNLKTTVEDEVSKLDNLKKRTFPRFYIDGNKSTSLFENMGEISLDKTDIHSFGDGFIKLSSMEQGFKSGLLSTRKTKHDPLVEENDPKILSEECNVQLDGSTLIQHMAQLPTPKCIATLPQAVCTPDVIIEEIIEDYPGTCFTEHPEDTHQRKLLQKRMVPFGLKADSPELVFVSCVVNPCHFYVRMLSQKKMLVHLEKILRQFCNSKNTSPTDILGLGASVFVKSKEHGMWCRATIIELIPKQNTNEGKSRGPTKYKICNVAMMQVFFIDFGHSEALTVSGFTNDVAVNPEHATLEYEVTEDLCSVVRIPDFLIEAQLRGINKLALKCSLKDIVPKRSSEGWSRAARTEFLKMVNKKTVQMRVFREEDSVLIVDLMKPPANKISSDMPVSLRDALVFLDLASFRTELADQSENSVPLQYCPPVMPQENTEVAIVVTYIISPGDFYIQMLDSPEFAFFLKKIDEIYKTESGDNLEILCPIQGQPCIAKFEDGIWYRAQVMGLPGHQQAEVKYVDYGNTAKINMKNMRKIKDEFLATPAKAIRCKLARIEPCKGTNEWSSKSKRRFEEMIHEKVMLCFFTEKLLDNILSVELYESVPALPNVSHSVNSLLVNEGLASYVTRNPQTTTIAYNEVWDPPPEETFSIEMEALNPEHVDLSQMEDLTLECNKKLQVRISHVVSPSKIFVHLQSAEKLLNSLQENMSATYNMSEEEETIRWEIDMNCAADIHGLDQWSRGQVCKIVSENTVEVFFFDFGITKTVNTICLRKLDENLMSLGPVAVECCLTDIRPSGGTDQWTATACDTLVQYLSGATVKIIIQEKKASPFPVKMFHRVDGLYTDISEYMIKEGLAFRKRRTDLIRALPEKSDEIPVEQENMDTNHSTAIEGCILSSSAAEQEADLVTDLEDKESKKSADLSRAVVTYKPPAIPSLNQFDAIVSCVADSGTIYVIPKSQEQQLSKLMNDIQNNVKCLGLLEPYSWKQGEACVVRGPDTLWYRGEVTEVGSGTIRVRYLDFGYIEKIPQCHLYPTVLYADIPPFSIPCQLYKTKPVGSTWQQDAVELLQELLTKRQVSVHIEERSDWPWGCISVKLFFSGMSLSSFMGYHKHCISEEDSEIPKLNIAECNDEPLEENCEISYEELLLSEIDTPFLPPYTSPSLPVLGALFPVKVTHIVSPNEVYLSLDQPENPIQQSDREDSGTSLISGCKTLKEKLTWWNQNIESCPCLTDFRKDMPCLAQYFDGSWHRAKLLYVKDFNPLLVMVLFVDYGATEMLPTSRLRQIPSNLMHYPAQAFRVLLAGFKPPLCDSETDRIPYCPEWSVEALWAMTDCIQGKRLQASLLTHSPEPTVFLYEDGCLVHMKLVEMRLAVLSQ